MAGGNSTFYASDGTASVGVGSVADWLTGEGADENDARAYAEGVRGGSALLVVSRNSSDVDRFVSIIDGGGALDIQERKTAWRTKRWQGQDEAAARL